MSFIRKLLYLNRYILVLFYVLVLLVDLWEIISTIIFGFMYLILFFCKDDNGYRRLLSGCRVCDNFFNYREIL